MKQHELEMHWRDKPDVVNVENDRVFMVAGRSTNLFNNPEGNWKDNKFPYYYTQVEGDFVVTCQVEPVFKDTYDLGSIIVWENEDKWIKFAYENTDCGYPAIVSVCTDGLSDDCNGPAMKGACWLQVSRRDNVFALHFSTDKQNWYMARIRNLDMGHRASVGISAQCPMGESCAVQFAGFEVAEYHLENQRAGK